MPDNETPELIPRLQLSRNWENPADFATHQHSEIQNRRDIQSLFTEIVSYLNNVMLPRAEQLLAEGGGGGGSGTGGGASGDYLPLDGGTMRGILRLFRDPALDAEAVTKRYADALAGAIRTDTEGNFTAISQRADGIELLAQNNKGDISSLQIQAKEISAMVQDMLGNFAQISMTSSEISSHVEEASGDFSEISQTADEISALVEDVDGNRSEISQKADAILSLIEDILGHTSKITHRAGEISANVEDSNGNASEIRQTSDEIAGSVEDANGNASEIRQKADAIKLILENPNGDSSAIQQLADEISGLVQDALGNTSLIQQNSGSISTLMRDATGDLSEIKQTVDGISARLSTTEGDVSEIRQTVDDISLGVSTVTENGEVFARLTLKIGENELYGYIKLDGNVDVSGQLSANALYAGYGEVANLAVDRLVTTRRIVKYLQGDRSDDNFIRAYEQNMEWVTGTCTGGTVQAKTPDGSPLYWPVDVSGLSRGADGYPVNAQQERIFTTTTPTGYPVQVYTYTEAVKRSISFEAVNGIYSPVDRFGAGNAQGNNKAWILKTADGFDIRYLTPDNKEIGIRMGADGKVTIDGMAYDVEQIKKALGMSGGGNGTGGESGAGGETLELTRTNEDGSLSGIEVDLEGYTDIRGLRKPTVLDFSNLHVDSGSNPFSFSETLDGGIVNLYRVQFDNSGRIYKITDRERHETVIRWGNQS